MIIVRTLSRDQQTRPLARALADGWTKDLVTKRYARGQESVDAADLAMRYVEPEAGLPCTIHDSGALLPGTVVEVSPTRALLRVKLDDGQAYVFLLTPSGRYQHGPIHSRHPSLRRHVIHLGIAGFKPNP